VTIFSMAYVVDQLKPAVPYKGLAEALVSDGWQRSSAVAVVDGPHALRSPLEWYLPGTPNFALRSSPANGEAQVFAVIGPRSPVRAAIRDAIDVDGWFVGKLPVGDVRNARAGLTLLAPRPSPERTLALRRRVRVTS
jgi:hypothetical protein